MDLGEDHILVDVVLGCLPPVQLTFPGGVNISVRFCVTPEEFEITENLLAADFLQEYGCVLDFRQKPPQLYLRFTDCTFPQHLSPKISDATCLCVPVRCTEKMCPEHHLLLNTSSTFNYVDESFAVNHGLLQVHEYDLVRLKMKVGEGWHEQGRHVR